MLGAIASGHDARHGLPRGRGLPGDAAGGAAPGRARRTARAPAKCVVEGVGLRGLGAPAARARHGQCGHGDAAVHGPARGQAFDSDAGRRCVADASPDGARRRAAARRWARASRHGTAARRSASAAARDCTASIRDAGGQRPGEVGACCWPACMPKAAPRVIEPAVTRDHTERMLRASASTSWRGAAPPRCTGRPELEAAPHRRAGRLLVRGLLPGRRLHRRAGARADRGRRHEPDAHRAARHAAR